MYFLYCNREFRKFYCSVRQITRLLDETNSPKVSRSAIRRDELMDWLLKKKVLSIALEGERFEKQYYYLICSRILVQS